jgi:hypothetical protein
LVQETTTELTAFAHSARAREAEPSGAPNPGRLWTGPPPISFCGIVFDLIDGGGGRGV